MKLSELQKRLEIMLEFRDSMHEFLSAKNDLFELKAKADQMYFHSMVDEEKIKGQAESIWKRYQTARTKVARRLAEATDISNYFELPTQLHILPPPAIGGYSRTLNLYQAAIEEELPFDFQLSPQKIGDAIDQTIFALEREIKEQPSVVKETLASAPKQVGSAVSFFFPKQIQRVIFGWPIILLVFGLLLRYVFGLHLEQVGQFLLKVLKIS